MFTDIIASMQDTPALVTALWVFLAGSMIALLRSAVDGIRRSFWRLIVGSAFGGLGAVSIYHSFPESDYVIIITIVAAIVAENIVVGLSNASKNFSKEPWPFIKEIFQVIVPGLSAIGDFMKTKHRIDNNLIGKDNGSSDDGYYGRNDDIGYEDNPYARGYEEDDEERRN